MPQNTRQTRFVLEENIQKAISEYRRGVYKSRLEAARAFDIPYATLHSRMSGRNSRAQAHEYRQCLSSAEEKTLAKWITRLTSTGFPVSPKLAVEIAEEIRRERFRIAKTQPPPLRPLGKHWTERFRTRYPEIQGVWTRQIENARFLASNVDTVKQWFDAVTNIRIQHQYPPECIYNMDESGFAVGTSQSSRAVVKIREKSSWKVVNGRQEWITAIECISAGGTVIPPLLIYKAKHTNTAWIPSQTPLDWRFSTSNSGWTSDSHAFEWVSTVFEPSTRPPAPQRRLLIMDGHGSHITANFITFCMEKAIDILILPPHCSHILQPLDVAIFAPLKHALAAETDAASRIDARRLPRVEWTAMYIRAREKAFTLRNIQKAWQATGLNPLSPLEVLDKLPQPTQRPRSTEPTRLEQQQSLDTSLLCSSPPEGTELRQANAQLHQALREEKLASPAKRYIHRMTHAFEATQSQYATVSKRLAEVEELLRTRKARKKGKRVSLQGRFVYTTPEVLEVTRAAEEKSRKKRKRSGAKTPSKASKLSDNEGDDLENTTSDCGSDCIDVAMKRVH